MSSERIVGIAQSAWVVGDEFLPGLGYPRYCDIYLETNLGIYHLTAAALEHLPGLPPDARAVIGAEHGIDSDDYAHALGHAIVARGVGPDGVYAIELSNGYLISCVVAYGTRLVIARD